ncbi:MAG: L-glutamate gamma-semialdehyde dehydrogenase [Chthonomonadales bacterium]
MLMPYQPETYVDFSKPEPRAKMLEALAFVKEHLGKDYPAYIAGKSIDNGEYITSFNPANRSQVVGRVTKCTAELAEEAIEAAYAAFYDWSHVSAEVRARYLLRVAAIIKRRYYEFSAWMVYEVSKSWIEAYADVAECIDFLEFYAREMMRLQGGHPVTPVPGEENELRYMPMGVCAVISPWNFPLAIMAGMTCAAAVTGNPVITKPAETSMVIAAKFYEVLQEARFPAGVVNFLPGIGEEVGEILTGHPLTRIICFTGSRSVGLHIHEKAAKTVSGQKWIKRTVLEMGGKDCIVVDEDADIDAAAEGVVAAAFGFQGQKCSACSRLVAHDAIYDQLLAKVVERASQLKMGDPTTEDFQITAVIDDESLTKINSYIEIGASEGRMVLGGKVDPAFNGGCFVRPTIFADVHENARIAQEEIFGPVLSVIRAKDFEHALQIANGTEYGLTGALYSRKREHLERARLDFHVGNLYLNRKCTGALVDVQPFGGFNMSGTDSKAGGRDYLQLFLQGKAIAERW